MWSYTSGQEEEATTCGIARSHASNAKEIFAVSGNLFGRQVVMSRRPDVGNTETLSDSTTIPRGIPIDTVLRST